MAARKKLPSEEKQYAYADDGTLRWRYKPSDTREEGPYKDCTEEGVKEFEALSKKKG